MEAERKERPVQPLDDSEGASLSSAVCGTATHRRNRTPATVISHLEKQLAITKECLELERKNHESTKQQLSVAVSTLQEQLSTISASLEEERAKVESLTTAIAELKEDHRHQLETIRREAEKELETKLKEENEIVWEQDKQVLRCRACNAEFGVLTRRHHCRSCGRVFCDNCSSQKAQLSRSGEIVVGRVCGQCFIQIQRDTSAHRVSTPVARLQAVKLEQQPQQQPQQQQPQSDRR